jgi:hypothetical protein
MDIMYEIICVLVFIGVVLYVRYIYFDGSKPIRPWLRGNPLVLFIVLGFIIIHILTRMLHH